MKTKGQFLEGPEMFSHPEISELLYSHIVNMNRRSVRYSEFQQYSSLGC